MRFLDRVGLALVAPARAFAAVDAEGERGRGGLPDAFRLLGLKFLALELKALVAIGWMLLLRGDVMRGVTLFGGRLSATLGTDLILILGAGAVVTVAAGRRRSPARDFDLAAVAWIPYLAVELAAQLVFTAARVSPSRGVSDALGVAALGAMAVWVILAIRHARRRPAPAKDAA